MEDIGSIISVLLRRLGVEEGELVFHPQAAFALFSYTYPMNIRELEQALRAAVALASDKEIRLEHLPEAVRAAASTTQEAVGEPAAAPDPDPRRAELVALLREHGGNVSAVARAAGRSRVQIHRWLRQFGVTASRLSKLRQANAISARLSSTNAMPKPRIH